MKHNRVSWCLLGTGIVMGALSLVNYATSEYSLFMAGLWIVSLVSCAAGLWVLSKPKRSNFDRRDWLTLVGLIVVFAPLYLWKLHQFPVQINTDEISIMVFFQKMATLSHADPFGIMPGYFGFPSGVFILFGKIGLALGGINLYHMRLIHACSGLAIVAASYGFFRQLMSRRWAVIATLILGISHSLFMISRMAMRDNTGLLIELVSLGLLIYGLKRQNYFWSFLGGAAAGLSIYTYYPARVVLPIWLAGLALYLVCGQPRIKPQRMLAIAAVTCLAWIITAGPNLLAAQKYASLTMPYQRQQFLFTKEGKALEREWVPAAKTDNAAIAANIRQGLGLFNNKLVDQGYIYPNYKHGFVDSVTGWLLWPGLLVVVVRIARRKASIGDILAVIGLISLWLAFSFFITKAPNYTRLLVVLPFVSYLVALLLRDIQIIFKTRWLGQVVAAVLVVWIAVGNLSAAQEFLTIGQSDGNNVGSTFRFAESLPHHSGYSLILAADPNHTFYSWGEPWQWQTWLSFGNQEARTVVTPPDLLIGSLPQNSFSVFMNNAVWREHQVDLNRLYPSGRFNQLTSSPALVVYSVQ